MTPSWGNEESRQTYSDEEMREVRRREVSDLQKQNMVITVSDITNIVYGGFFYYFGEGKLYNSLIKISKIVPTPKALCAAILLGLKDNRSEEIKPIKKILAATQINPESAEITIKEQDYNRLHYFMSQITSKEGMVISKIIKSNANVALNTSPRLGTIAGGALTTALAVGAITVGLSYAGMDYTAVLYKSIAAPLAAACVSYASLLVKRGKAREVSEDAIFKLALEEISKDLERPEPSTSTTQEQTQEKTQEKTQEVSQEATLLTNLNSETKVKSSKSALNSTQDGSKNARQDILTQNGTSSTQLLPQATGGISSFPEGRNKRKTRPTIVRPAPRKKGSKHSIPRL